MGIGDEVPAGIAQLGAAVTMLGEQDLATGDLRAVRRDRDRHTRVRGPRGSQDLQPPPARLREGRRQPDRAVQHAGVRARSRTRRIQAQLPARAEEVSEEDSPVEILAASHQAFNSAEPDHEGRLRRLGGAAGLEVLHRVGRGVHADDCDLRPGSGAAEGRLADRRATARGTTPTSPTPSTASCRTACREPTACSRICSRSVNRDKGLRLAASARRTGAAPSWPR